MSWTISWEEFRTFVEGLVAISDEINDGWAWQGDQEHLAGAYVAKKMKQPMKQSSPENLDEVDQFEDDSCQIDDHNAVVEHAADNPVLTWEYHILYSPSYATPVLYFNAFTPDGHLVSLDFLWKGLGGGSQEVLQQLRWEALSQQEHPILRRPFFYLHPCKTAEFLNIHQGTSSNPVVTWLSSMGPAIGLHLDNTYGQLVSKF